MAASLIAEGRWLRQVQPELLDELPAEDPRAQRSRRDLRRVNQWMGNARILARRLSRLSVRKLQPWIVELGGGDGTFMLKVAERLGPVWRQVRLEIVDRQRLVTAETVAAFAQAGWNAHPIGTDAFEWLKRGEAPDVITANLFLHHFEEQELRELLRLAAWRTHAFVACEPRRFPYPWLAGQLLWIIGCSAVTRHDAIVSIRGGFREEELSALWPKQKEWRLEEGRAGFFSHCFGAERI